MGRTGESGRWGEDIAAAHLKARGWRVLGVRVRVDRRDELDLVAVEGDVLVFVEVKTRQDEWYGRPAAAVKPDKRRILSRAAMRYIKRLREPRICFRFDIIEVIGQPGDEHPAIRHIENAFPLDRRYALP